MTGVRPEMMYLAVCGGGTGCRTSTTLDSGLSINTSA
jgi:hypothetical protein